MVNTFLVHSDFTINARFLDLRRLGKQRVEARQIIDVLTSTDSVGNPPFLITASRTDITKKGWKNHPATKAWEGHVESLKHYFNCIVREWIARGCNNNYELYDLGDETKIIAPHWTKSPRIHYSMMAQLMQKDPHYYNDTLSTKIPDELFSYFKSMPIEYLQYGYIWPAKFTSDDLDKKPLSELASERQEHKLCEAWTKSGNPCRNKAKPHTLFCGVHKR